MAVGPLPTRSGQRHVMRGVLALAIVAGSAWLVTQSGLDWPRMLDALRAVDPWWLALAAAASLAGYVGYALVLQAVVRLDGGPLLPLGLALRTTIAVFGASALFTSAGRLGVEYWSMRRLGAPPGPASARVIALNTASCAVLAFLTAAAALGLTLTRRAQAPLSLELTWVLLPCVCVLLAVLVLAGWRRLRRTERQGRLWAAVRCLMRALSLVGALATERGPRPRGAAGTLIYWSAEMLVLWAGLRAFGISEPPAALVVGYATGFVATLLPLPVGGIGGVEAAGVAGLAMVGVAAEPALLAVFVQRLCTYWLPVGAALVAARRLRALPGRFAAVAGDVGPRREAAVDA